MKELINDLSLIRLLILAFGAYSVTRLLVTDDFPLFSKPREAIFHRFPHDGYSSSIKPKRGKFIRSGSGFYVNKGHWIGELFHCPWCMGWWVSLVISGAYFLSPIWTLAVLLPFGLRAFVGGLAMRFGG